MRLERNIRLIKEMYMDHQNLLVRVEFSLREYLRVLSDVTCKNSEEFMKLNSVIDHMRHLNDDLGFFNRHGSD